MKTVAIVDLDAPCYASAAVCDNRSIKVTNPKGKSKRFKTRTEFKKSSLAYPVEEYTIEDVQEPEPISHACHTLKVGIERILETLQPDEVIYIISGSSNFRDNLPLPYKYKSSREDMLRPALLKDVREFAKNKYKPILPDNDEADDVQIYLGYEELSKGNKPIIVTIDKDCKAYSSLFHFNQDKPELGIVEIPDLGYLEITQKDKVQGYGFLWYCHQMLIGDKVDGYRPTDLCKVKFGEKSSYALLKDCKSKEQALDIVVNKYKEWYPEPFEYKAWNGEIVKADYQSIIDLYHKCARMKSTKNDELNFWYFYNGVIGK